MTSIRACVEAGGRKLRRGKAWMIPGFGTLTRRRRKQHLRRVGKKTVSVRGSTYLTADPTATFRRKAGM